VPGARLQRDAGAERHDLKRTARTSLKSFFIYVGMVGLPLLGLLSILRAGSALEAPRAFGGDWTVSMAAPAPADVSAAAVCALPGGSATLRVAQSGTRAELALHTVQGRHRLSGRIEDGRLTASGGEPGCARIQLALVPEDSGRIERMHGALSACAERACFATPIVAQRAARVEPPR
jgi:hypothetical protein